MKIDILACTRCYRQRRTVVPATVSHAVGKHTIDVCGPCDADLTKALVPFTRLPRRRQARRGQPSAEILAKLAAHRRPLTTEELGRNHNVLFALHKKKLIRRVAQGKYVITAAGRTAQEAPPRRAAPHRAEN